jgi:5'-nucleotidase/UDP-sugar diphosphatase
MKKTPLAFLLVTALFLVACEHPSNSSSSANISGKTGSDISSTSSSKGTSTSQGTSSEETSYSSPEPSSESSATSHDPTLTEIDLTSATPITFASQTSSTTGTLSAESVPFTVNKADATSSAGFVTFNQGGLLVNTSAFSSFSGLKVTFTRLTDYGSLTYRYSNYAISSPENGAYECLSGTTYTFPSASAYVSVYAPIGRFQISSVILYVTTASYTKKAADTIDFYSFNDVHGAAEFIYDTSSSKYQMGINRFSTYLQGVTRANPEGSVVLSSGDMWQGSADSNITHGELMVNWMNIAGFESMAIGNHEFDWGISHIQSNESLANFPFLGINIVDSSGNRPSWALPSKVIYRSGYKIGIIGAIGKLESSIAVSTLAGTTFRSDYATMVHDEAARLRTEGCSLVVLSIHNGEFDTTNCHNIDAVFEGHTHTRYSTVDTYGIPHVQDYANGSGCQHVSFTRTDNSFAYASADESGVNSTTETSVAEEKMTKEYYQYELDTRISAVKNEVVGTTSTDLSKQTIGTMGAKALYLYYHAIDSSIVGASINTGGVRQTIAAGTVTYGDIYATFPFDNDNTTVSMRGSALSSLLSNTYYYSYSTLTSSEISSSSTYKIMTLSYVSEGAGSSTMTITERFTDLRLRDVLKIEWANVL